MTDSEISSGSNLTTAREPNSARRRIGSNIGLRRQHHIPQNVAGTVVQSNTQLVNESGSQRTIYRNGESQTRDRRQPSLKAVQSRTRTIDRGEIPTTESERETSRENSSGGNSDSLSTILTNPDLDILPVERTDQARASFDFCRSLPFFVWL